MNINHGALYNLQGKSPVLKPLGVSNHQNATVVPLSREGPGDVLRGGVISKTGKVERSSLLYRNFSQIVFPPEAPPAATATIGDQAIYGGFIFNHFGHFILESLARLWVCQTLLDEQIVFTSSEALTNWQLEIFDILGLLDRIRILREPTVCRKLTIPNVGYRIQDYMHPDHAEFLGCSAPKEEKEITRPLWLSRAALPAQDRIEGEKELESVLLKSGWNVVHPEALPVSRQLALIESASIVAGVEGSALHAITLVKRISGPVVVFRRLFNQNYHTISTAKNIHQIDFVGAIGRCFSLGSNRYRFVSPTRSAEMLDEFRKNWEHADLKSHIDAHDLPRLSLYQDDVCAMTSPYLGAGAVGGKAALREILAVMNRKLLRR